MTIDSSAVARVVGIEANYKDLRSGSSLFLPMRIAVFAQGASASSYPTTKFQAESAAQVGAVMGYGSPAHLIARQLLPQNGDGVGTIPVTIYPLTDDGSGVASSGDITPSGTQTKAAAYKLRIGGVESNEFVVPKGAIDVTYVCAEMGKAVLAVLHMPVTVVYSYGTIVATPDGSNTGDGTLGSLSATGSPTPGDYTLVCNTAAVDGGTFTLTDPDGTIISTSIDVSGAPQTAAGIQFTLSDGSADYIVGDSFTLTVPATDVAFPSKWKGTSANGIGIEVLGDTTLGTTFAITQPTGGLVNPSVNAAIAQVGQVWETFGLNALDGADTTALDAFQAWGDARYTQNKPRPIVVFRGNNDASKATATVITAARTDDKVNAQLTGPGSPNLPCVIAARELAKIARIANNNPARDYGSQRATGLIPGTDAEQWDYTVRDQAVKAGSSTVEVRDGVVTISDVVTHYAPAGEPIPAYRFVVAIVKLMNVMFNIEATFAVPKWDGAPLIPNNQATTNPDAKKPNMAITAINNVIDGLALDAIISNPKAAKAATTADIDSQNNNRLNVSTTVQLSGNTNQIPINLNFGFYFGGAAA